jgi:hypothetical protein
VYLYRETRLCIDLRDMDVAGIQQRSGCCGECLMSFGTEMVLFFITIVESDWYTYYLSHFQPGHSKVMSVVANLLILSQTPMSNTRERHTTSSLRPHLTSNSMA